MPTEVARVQQESRICGLVYKSAPSIPFKSTSSKRLLLGLEVVEEDGSLLRLLTPVLDDNARAVDDLAGVTLTIQDA